MPWTKKDVSKFKSGLNDAEKAEWVKIANAIYNECVNNGGSDSDCSAKAIRTASSRVGNNSRTDALAANAYTHFTQNVQPPQELQVNYMEDQEYLLAPVIPIVEGVHNGSAGRVLYKEEELSRYPEAWNGRVVPLYHPTDDDGQPMTANSPEQWEARKLGWLFGVNVVKEADQNGQQLAKMKATAWLSKKDLEEKAPEVLRALQEGLMLEVSTGLFSDWAIANGMWNGEQYDMIATNIRPDHLAILPGQQGACSIEDGAGIPRVNSKQGDNDKKSLWQKLKAWVGGVDNAEMSHWDMEEALRQIIRGKYNSENTYARVEDVYDDYFLYSYEDSSSAAEERIFKQSYTAADGDVQLVGEPQEVKIKKEIVPVEAQQSSEPGEKNANSKGEGTMDKEAIIKALIDNSETFTEDDRQMLENKELNALQQLHDSLLGTNEGDGGGENKSGAGQNVRGKGQNKSGEGDPGPTAEKPAQPAANGNNQQSVNEPPAQPQNLREWADQVGLPQHLREQLEDGEQQRETERQQLINNITAQPNSQFTKEELGEYSNAQLRKMASLVPNAAPNMNGRVPAGAATESEDAPPTPQSLSANSRKVQKARSKDNDQDNNDS